MIYEADRQTEIGQNLPPEQKAALSRQVAFFAGSPLIRPLLDAIPGVIFVLNSDRQIVFANRALQEVTGLSAEESLVGRKPGDVMACRSAVHAEWGCGTGEACSTCGALTAIMTGLDGREDVQECLLTRKVGDDEVNLTLRVIAVPLEHAGEQFTVLSGTDISHERRRLVLERTFFHDILNLIGSIRGFAELMDGDADVDTTELSRLIHTTSQRVVDEIDAQRMLLAAEKGELRVSNDLLQSRALLAELINLYQGQDLARDKQLTLLPEAEDRPLLGDRVILGRILGNMLKNALEASRRGEVVSISCFGTGDGVVFRVHNPAVIPESLQPRVFQRDFSTKGAGRGLGTYSMKLLSELIGGDIAFTSRPGDGTVFSLVLPLTTGGD